MDALNQPNAPTPRLLSFGQLTEPLRSVTFSGGRFGIRRCSNYGSNSGNVAKKLSLEGGLET